MQRPKFLTDEAFRCLRSGDAKGFARYLGGSKVLDFTDADFRGTDFRHVDVAKIVLRGAYLKDADLRGLDLRKHDLEGCSLHHAKIGGTYFPENVDASEIQMSVVYGTRIRTRRSPS